MTPAASSPLTGRFGECRRARRGDATVMRAWCFLDRAPTPDPDGHGDRLVALLRAWASLATLDIVVRQPLGPDERAGLEAVAGEAVVHDLDDTASPLPAARLRVITHRKLSVEAARVDPGPPRRALRRILSGCDRPDAVFAGGPLAAWLARPLVPPVPWFLDVAPVHGPAPWSVPVTSGRELVAGLDVRTLRARAVRDRQARFELHQAGAAHLATVASPGEREALGAPNAVVVADAEVPDRYPAVVLQTIAEAGAYRSRR